MTFASSRHIRAAVLAVLLLLSVVISVPVFATPGSFDPGFGGTGKVIFTSDNTKDHIASATVIQPDNKIVIAGRIDGQAAVTRLNADGTLDTSFGTAGYFIYTETETSSFVAAALHGDGIVLVGRAGGRGIIFRLDSAGVPDAAFNANIAPHWRSGDDLYDVVVTDAQQLIVVGREDLLDNDNQWVAVRFNAVGTLDDTFGVNGIFTANPGVGIDILEAVAFDTLSNALYVAGSINLDRSSTNFAVARLSANGVLDTSFGTDGIFRTKYETGTTFNTVANLHVLPDGRVVVGGDYGNYGVGVARLTTAGALDASFGTGGILKIEAATSSLRLEDLAVDASGNLLLLTYSFDELPTTATLHRRTSTGAPDTSFAGNGRTNIRFGQRNVRQTGIAIDGAGRYITVGRAAVRGENSGQFAVARLAGAVPDSVTTLSPSGTITSAMTPFLFNASQYAAQYRLQVQGRGGIAYTFTTGWVNADAVICEDTCVLMPSANSAWSLVEGGTYRWRVQARNAAGLVNSAWTQFTVDTLPESLTAVYPTQTDENVSDTQLNFVWNLSEPLPANFRLIVQTGDVNVYRSPLVSSADACDIEGCSILVAMDDLAATIRNGQYRWRVNGVNPQVQGNTTTRWTRFTYAPLADRIEEAGAVNDTNPVTLRWTDDVPNGQYRVLLRRVRPNGNFTPVPDYTPAFALASEICEAGLCDFVVPVELVPANYQFRVEGRVPGIAGRVRSRWEAFSVVAEPQAE